MRTGRFPALLVVLVTLTVGLPAAGAPAEVRGAQVKQQNGNGGDQDSGMSIAECEAALGRRGPNARRERDKAIFSLFANPAPEAHEILQRFVGPGEDPDGVRRKVLTQLAGLLTNQGSGALWHPENGTRIRRVYVMKLTGQFDGKPPASKEDDRLRRLARDALLAMPGADLEEALKQQLASGNGELKMRAIHAAGQTRNPLVAKLLAPSLDDKDQAVQAAARAALHDLTYQDFADQRSFAAWWEDNSDREYLELAEAAAREARRTSARKVGAANAAHVDTLQHLVEVLATSTRKDKWKDIRATVFAPEPRDVLQKTLERLCGVLASVPADAKAVDAKDRLLFLDELAQRMAAGASDGDYALMLEAASYLCAPGEAQCAAQEARLTAGVTHRAAVVRLAALRGLRRFFSPANRITVIKIVAQAHADKDVPLLQGALATLTSDGWLAPKASDGDLAAWVEALRDVVVAPSLDDDVRIDAIKAMGRPDADGQRPQQVFKLLCDEVVRPTHDVKLRSVMMFSLLDLLPDSGKARDELARQYLDVLGRLQKDENVNMRLDAARRVEVPSKLSIEKELGQDLVRQLGELLLVETNDAVFAAQVEALKKLCTKSDAHVPAVNTRMRVALDTLRSKPGTAQRVATLIGGLASVALNTRRTTAEWYETCSRLLAVPGAGRKSIGSILEFHIGRTPQKLNSEPQELQLKVHRLVLQTANQRPPTEPWTKEKDAGEARMVQRAYAALLAADEFAPGSAAKKDSIDTPRTRLTCLRCLAVIEDSVTLEKQVVQWLGDQVLQGPDRDAARLLYAESLLQQDKLEDAWAKSELQTVNGPHLDERLRLTDAIAAKMIAAKKLQQAEPLLQSLKEKTPADSQAYWPRFSTWLRVKHGLDPKAGAELVQMLDAWAKGAPALYDQVKQEADSLRRELLGSAVPGK